MPVSQRLDKLENEQSVSFFFRVKTLQRKSLLHLALTRFLINMFPPPPDDDEIERRGGGKRKPKLQAVVPNEGNLGILTPRIFETYINNFRKAEYGLFKSSTFYNIKL